MPRVRPPAVAGLFYPGDPDTLRRLVDGLVSTVPVPPDERLAVAYIVPHAGYRYSGPTAAHAYARLRHGAPGVRRVLLLGPAHYSRMRGCAVPATEGWRTPLGDASIDVDTAHRLVAGGYACADDGPFVPEHSLEVQLPFLQRCLPPVPVLPVAIGPSTVDEVAALLACATDAGTAVLCSTDLSHYLTQDAATQQDARTADAVLDLAPERIGTRDACGVFALRGLLAWARAAGLRAHLLRLTTSAETGGDPRRVVGYGAFALTDSG
jgi:AmmeMemoRadiSam system protein B